VDDETDYVMSNFDYLLSSSFSATPLRVRWKSFRHSGCSVHCPRGIVPWVSADENSWNLPPHTQARWADVICVANAGDPAFNEQMLREADDETKTRICARSANVTALGNVAFMATSFTVPVGYREKWIAVAKTMRDEMAPGTVREEEFEAKDYAAPGEWLNAGPLWEDVCSLSSSVADVMCGVLSTASRPPNRIPFFALLFYCLVMLRI